MKLDTKYKPELVIYKGDDRFQLADPYFDADAKKVVATDGYRMVVIPVETEDGEASHWVDCRAIGAARQISDGGVVSFPEKVRAFGANFNCIQKRGEQGFPKWKEALPEAREGDAGTVTFGVNIDLLVGLADALGCSEGSRKVVVTVPLRGARKALLVRHYDEKDGAYGALMPMRHDATERGTEGIVVVSEEK